MLRTRNQPCAIRYRGGHPAQKPCGMHRCVQPLEHGQHRAQQIQDVTKPRFSVGVCNRWFKGVLTHRVFRLVKTLPRLQAVWSTFINTAQLDSMAGFNNTGSVCSRCRGRCKPCRGGCMNCRGVLTVFHRRHGSVNSRAAGVATGPGSSTSDGQAISRPTASMGAMAGLWCACLPGWMRLRSWCGRNGCHPQALHPSRSGPSFRKTPHLHHVGPL